MARARMNAPMKRNISGSANGAKTVLAGATPSSTHAEAPARAVTGSGNVSVTHNTMTAAMTAARRCASGERAGNGSRRIARNAAGASSPPRRRRSEGSVIGPYNKPFTLVRHAAIADPSKPWTRPGEARADSVAVSTQPIHR